MAQEETESVYDNKRSEYPNPEIVGEQFKFMVTGICKEDSDIAFKVQRCLERETGERERLEREYITSGYESDGFWTGDGDNNCCGWSEELEE